MASAAMQQIPSVRFHQAEKFGYGTPEEILVERVKILHFILLALVNESTWVQCWNQQL